jgi:hypothetical protein
MNGMAFQNMFPGDSAPPKTSLRYTQMPQQWRRPMTCLLMTISSFQMYRQHDDFNMPAVRYEDLVAAPQKMLEAVFKHCGLSHELIPKAKTALQKDSQSSSILSRSALSRTMKDGVAEFESRKEDVLAFLDDFGLDENLASGIVARSIALA